jgi:hypothetical protein
MSDRQKPAWYHFVVAHTPAIAMGLGVVGMIGFMIFIILDAAGGAWIADIWIWLRIVFTAIVFGLLGWILGMFIYPILCIIAIRLQGGPFVEGDEVIVLTKPYQGVKTKIYEVWESRGEVRLDLGSDLKASCKDVFSTVEVCKAK